MYSVRKIIAENWEFYISRFKVDSHSKREVEKMLDCSRNSCNSRICSSCGKRYADAWSNALPFLPVKHVVLTVPSCLRLVLGDWANLGVLMRSSKDFFQLLI
jgi:DNA-directed RNA polymerase subunit N (RpoN/RPB10)